MATTEKLYEEITIAGFGGQGVLLTGKLLAQTGMAAGKEVTYMPSYGAEVRGGTANCMVVISDEPIACPIVSSPRSLVVMSKASLTKFGSRVTPGGVLLFNSSQIDGEPEVDASIDVIAIPADEVAAELGSPKSANMVMLGAYLQKRGYFTVDEACESLPSVLAKRYHKMISVNAEAMTRGAEFVLCHA